MYLGRNCVHIDCYSLWMGCWHLDYLPLLHQPVIQTWPGSSAYSPRLLRLHGGVHSYRVTSSVQWPSGGQESGPLCRMLTTERSVVLKVAMFLSWNPSQQSTVCFHVIPLRLIARWNGNSFLCKVAVNLKQSPRWIYGSDDVHSMDSFLRRQKEETICLVRAWIPPRWCRNTAATRQNTS